MKKISILFLIFFIPLNLFASGIEEVIKIMEEYGRLSNEEVQRYNDILEQNIIGLLSSGNRDIRIATRRTLADHQRLITSNPSILNECIRILSQSVSQGDTWERQKSLEALAATGNNYFLPSYVSEQVRNLIENPLAEDDASYAIRVLGATHRWEDILFGIETTYDVFDADARPYNRLYQMAYALQDFAENRTNELLTDLDLEQARDYFSKMIEEGVRSHDIFKCLGLLVHLGDEESVKKLIKYYNEYYDEYYNDPVNPNMDTRKHIIKGMGWSNGNIRFRNFLYELLDREEDEEIISEIAHTLQYSFKENEEYIAKKILESKERRLGLQKKKELENQKTTFVNTTIQNNLDQLIEFLSSDVNEDGEISEEDVEILDMAAALKEAREKFIFLFKNLNVEFSTNPLRMISLIKKILNQKRKKLKEILDQYELIKGLKKELGKRFLEKFTFDLKSLDVNSDGTLNFFDVVFAKKEQKLSEDIKKDAQGKIILVIRKK